MESNSSKSLFKNPINDSYFTKSKKHFLKKELFNGTFYPSKSVSTKFYVMNPNIIILRIIILTT